MAHKTADRVRETTTSTGTGDIVLAGAFSGYKAFSSVLTIGDTFYYAIAAYPGADWEVGLGTYSATNTITRTTVLASSNANAAVTFAAGTKEVFITAAADKLIQLDNLGNSNIGTATGVSFNSITGLSSVVGSTPGTAAIGTSTTVARADHVHPIQTTVSGNAGTATTWQTARTLTIGNTGKSVNGSANVTWSLAEIGAVASTEKGAVNGVATLDATGKVPSTQLPSYVDDVLEYANLAAFPATGETGKIYIALDTNKTYRWSGSAYVYITSGAVDSVNGQTGVVTISTISGNAGTATTWETARTLTVGLTGKSVNGSANVSWSLAEIGALPLTGGTLTGGLVGTSATFTGTVSWGNSVGQSNGNPRTLAIGYSGGNYGSAGYGISYTTTSDVHNYAIADIASLWQAYDGIVVSAAPAGTVGTPVTWTTVLDARRSNASLLFKGSTVLDTSNYTTYVPTKTGTGATGTWNISVSGNSASSSALATWDGSTPMTPGSALSSSGSRTTDLAPNTYSRGVFSEFKNSSLFGFTGNYTGLVTVAPWLGTAASTGDPNYQLSFNPSAANSTSNPSLKIRAGIDTTWGAWNTILHSGNYNSYSPTLSGTGASGTWGISVTGNAATATALQTARTISLTGGVTGSTSFNGTANVSITATVANDSHTHSNYMLRSQSVQANPNTNFASSAYRFDPNANNPTNDYYSILTYGNESNVVGQLATHFQTGQTFTRSYNTSWSAWRTQLDSTNYNSYAPTLTGTGASGTWGISVTGSAGSLSNNVDYMVNRGSIDQANQDNATSNGFYTRINTGDSSGLLVFNPSGSVGPWQMHVTYAGLMEFRNKTDSTTWTSWKTVLTSANYNSYSPTLTGTGASGTWGISVTGNAGTATTLQTARTINGVSFNGSADITVAANTTNTLSIGSYLTGSNFNGSAATTWAVDATSANTASKVVARDASGNFSAGTITASLSGNASTATTLQTARTINGVSFNGSANITVTANTTNAVTFNNGGAGAASGSTFNGSGALTVSYNTVGAPSTTGTGASGTWGINISGNAATATSATDSTKLPLTGGTLSNPITFTSSSMIIGYSGAQTRGYVYSDSGGIGFLTNSGSWAARIDFGTANLNCFANISAAGNIYATGNVTAYSDERVKKNWRNVEEGFVDKLANVKSGIYDRTDAEMTQVGVSAQSLQEILPNAIEEKDDKLSVAYGNAALVSAIELAKEIVKLKQEIESLKEKLKEGT